MTEARRLSLGAKAALAGRIWSTFLRARIAVRRVPLPQLARELGYGPPRSRLRVEPRRLGRIVRRVLRVGPWRPRCLFSALVLYRLLHEQGDAAELVIGMPHRPTDRDAHAWVEVGGVDVGPPPGSLGHEGLARFS